MIAEDHGQASPAAIAAVIGDAARSAMLYCLMDGHARTSTELSVVAGVSPSTASAHLGRLLAANLVKVGAQGRHRYFSLSGADVAAILEHLSVLAGHRAAPFEPRTPARLRHARSCYDHLAGEVGVRLHERFKALGYLRPDPGGEDDYEVSAMGSDALRGAGVDVQAARKPRRRFAYDCLDWSERRPHLGGALGSALLASMVSRGWLIQDLDGRAIEVTDRGRRELRGRFGVEIETLSGPPRPAEPLG